MPIKEDLSNLTDDCTIFRYIDFYKLEDLLNKNALYFRNLKAQQDDYEGEMSNREKNIYKKITIFDGKGNNITTELGKNIFKKAYALLNSFVNNELYISCWNIAEHESEEMWTKELEDNTKSIVIKTNIGSLKSAFEISNEQISMRKVEYKDLDSCQFEGFNPFGPSFRKRIKFSYEHELRLVFFIPIPFSYILTKYFYIKVDTKKLIPKIIVSPYANRQFYDGVQVLLLKYHCNAQLENSELGKY